MEHSDEGHGHVHVHEDGEEDGHLEEDESQYEIEYDEHIWTSPVNAMRMVDVIAETLTERDPDHGAMYQAGAAAYLEELERLDKEFREDALYYFPNKEQDVADFVALCLGFTEAEVLTTYGMYEHIINKYYFMMEIFDLLKKDNSKK